MSTALTSTRGIRRVTMLVTAGALAATLAVSSAALAEELPVDPTAPAEALVEEPTPPADAEGDVPSEEPAPHQEPIPSATVPATTVPQPEPGPIESPETPTEPSADVTPPTITADWMPRWDEWSNRESVTFRATDADSGIAELYVDDGEIARTAGESFTYRLEEGSYSVSAWAVDAQGNASAPLTIQVNIDRVAPTLTIEPVGRVAADGAWELEVGEVAIFRYTAADDRAGLHQSGSSHWPDYAVDTTEASEFEFFVSALDRAGNSSELHQRVRVVAPGPTEPAPTEPTPTDPAPTDPAPTEPQPTEPGQPVSPSSPALGVAQRDSLAFTGHSPATALGSAAALFALLGAVLLTVRARRRA
ncbi:type IV secretory pathway VirB10-like protein [Microbacteriaceae bacterium SG_E_30_P1]|uniref:Type IV secretory pathway VirB10-like protein n=1 Tax=Antiquaquibacter oligotrophicus TaxID=2880260 RepID=A0ABT6KQQ7_9MICO|nr:hypothetical protein [Antiquaquibacter oligotrophicus]MDH6182317.1 type IV secretory pathway VirB10-like protein [Antiquaquibacter oligotrophicus]